MLRRENSRKITHLKVCPTCKKEFVPKSRGKVGQKQVHCSQKCRWYAERKIVTKNCRLCGKEFTFRSSGKRNNDKRKFCGTSCAAKWRMAQPERRERMKEYMPRMLSAAHAAVRGKSNPVASPRMKANKPTANPEWRKRTSILMSGR